MKKIFTLCLSVFLLLGVFAGVSLSSSAVAVGQMFRFEIGAGDWGKGTNPIQDGLWVFEWFDEETDTFGLMRWAESGSYFEAPFATAAASDVHWYCRHRSSGANMHPGAKADSVRTFVCPESGEIEYSVIVARQAAVSGSNNGNSLRIFRNETLVWPVDQENGYQTLETTAAVTVTAKLTVQKGDKIRLMVGSLGNSNGDGVDVLQNTVTYLSGENLTPEEENPEGKTLRIACVGDSITAGYKLANPAAESFPARLQELLGEEYTVLNFGNSAKTLLSTGNDPYIKTATYQSSLASDPDIVIIELGSNDAKAVNWKDGASKEQFKSDYLALIEAYRNLPTHPEIYICTSPFVRPGASTSISASVIANEIGPLEKEIAEEAGCEVIDLFACTSKLSAADFDADGLHPSASGAQKLAQYIFDFLQAAEEEDPSNTDQPSNTDNPSNSETEDTSKSVPWILGSIIVAVVILAGISFFVFRTEKKKQ